MARKTKSKTLLKRKVKGLGRENTVHPHINQIVIVTKIHQRTQTLAMDHHQNLQRRRCPRMSIPHRGSLPSLQQKNKWKFSKQLKKWAKARFLKHISDQKIKESILENNPLLSNFLSRQKLDDYLLEILSEAWKKHEIFTDRSLIKAQENLININWTIGSPLDKSRSP